METEKQQSMLQTYRQFMQIGLNGGDPGLLRKIVDEHISGFGSAMDEKVHGFDGLSKLLDTQIKQSKGLDIRWRMEPVSQFVTPDENTAVFADDVFLRIDSGEEIIEMYLRFSAVLHYIGGQWKVIHWHGSKPEAVESEKDTWGLESWKQKAGELEKLVAEKTSDLVEKNRELEIEAALERVRARTMAMQKSDELPEAANLLFQQVQSLGMPAWSAGYCIWNDDKSAVTLWMSSEGVLQPPFIAPTTEDELFKQMRKGLEDGKDLHICEMGGKDLELHYQYMRTLPVVGKILDSIIDAGHPLPTFQIMHQAYFSKGFLLFITYEPVPEAHEIFKRFASVFDQTYTRFLDLQKAEAQAREAEIQLALERVRARTMAMHKSDELAEVAVLLFQQVKALGITTYSSGFTIWNTGENVLFSWMCNADGSINPPFIMPATEYDWHRLQYQSWKNKEDHIVHDFTGEEMERHYRYLRSFPLLDEAFRKSEQAGIETPVRQVHNVFNFSYGNLLFITLEPAEECFDVFSRFSKVFEQCYTRFLDLQKAEAQAREAQIETALERIRARALAMHNSNELTEVAKVLREQMSSLGQPELETSAVHLYDEDPDYILSWRAFRLSSYLEGNITYGFFKIPKGSCEIANEFIEKFKSSETDYTIEVSGARQAEWYKILFKLAPEVHEAMKNSGTAEETRYYHFSKFSGGALLMVSSKEPSKDAIELQKRSAQVFDLAYRRFKDLQKVEEQAREAQIEAALERLRSRSMAMHDSSDLSAVVFAMFTELVKLDAQLDRCLILIVNPQTLGITWYLTGKEGLLSNNGFFIPDNNHPSHKAYLDGWRTKRKKWQYLLAGEEKKQWDAYGFFETELKQLPDFIKADMAAVEAIHLTISSDDFGCLIASSLSPLSDTHASIVERFTIVFNQTYTRFLDLKKAEAQAREAEIQLALERVRARSLAMHHTNELQDVVNVVAQQLLQMGIDMDGGVFIAINDEVTNDFPFWAAAGAADYVQKVTIPFFDRPTFTGLRDAIVQRQPFYTDYFSKEEKNEFLLHMFRYHPWNQNSEERKAELLARDGGYTRSVVVNHYTSIGITNHHGKKFSDSDHDILKRFGAVLEQSYIRFLDLQKAEAQAREAEIQLGLERVRARTMAMHKSDEMGVMPPVSIPNTEDEEHKAMLQGWKENREYLLSQKDGESLAAHYRYLYSLPQMKAFFDPMLSAGFQFPAWQQWHAAYFSKGYLLIITTEPYGETDIFRRFAKVFDQTYTRFLDLQRAEAQAREAQIEAGLERVRAKTMAMHSSDDVSAATATMFLELEKLGVENLRGGITIIKPNQVQEVWSITNLTDGRTVRGIGVLDMRLHPFWQQIFNAWKSKADFDYYSLKGEDKQAYIDILNGTSNYLSQPIKEFPDAHIQSYFFKEGAVWTNSLQPHSIEDQQIMKRFASVFDQTYTRFLDLQKAEAQAKEAKIESALERVRSRSLAMHHSSELSAVVDTLLREFTNLEFSLTFCIINLINEQDRRNTVWAANPETGKDPESYYMKFEDYPFHHAMWDAWKAQEKRFIYTIEGEEKKIYDEYLYTETEFRRFPKHVQDANKALKRYVAGFTFFKYSGLQTVSENLISDEDLSILERFGRVFEQSYTRFLDLQKAEAQAREAQIEAALERVRSGSMAMHDSKELGEVAKVMFNQMKLLGGELFAFGIVLCDKHKNTVEQWHGLGEGDMLKPFRVPVDLDYIHRYRYDQWKAGAELFSIEIPSDYIARHFELMFELPSVKALLDDLQSKGIELAHPSWEIDYGASFKHGYLLVSSLKPFAEDKIFPRFAKVFEQAYTRFLDLQKAEAQAREAQIEVAVERVRAKALAMHKSSEISALANTLRHELVGLNIPGVAAATICLEQEDGAIRSWDITSTVEYEGEFHFNMDFVFDLTDTHPTDWIRRVWDPSRKYYIIEQDEADIQRTIAWTRKYNSAFADTAYRFLTENSIKQVWHPVVSLEYGKMSLDMFQPPPAEAEPILIKMGAAFDLAYKRFLDLQKAEAQAREAQIQLGLERVRARTMAMQKQQDLFDVVNAFGEQLVALGLRVDYVSFINGIISKDRDWDLWGCNPNLKLPAENNLIPYKKTAYFTRTAESVDRYERTGYPIQVKTFTRDEKDEFFDHYFSYAAPVPQEFKQFLYDAPGSIIVDAFLSEVTVSLCRYDLEPYTDEQLEIFKRFSIEFRQAYIRFLDLQKAEAQARVAQVERSLERIRAHVTSMQRSSDLFDIVVSMRNEFISLGHQADYFWHMRWASEHYELSMTSDDGSRLGMVINVPKFVHEQIPRLHEWEKGNSPVMVLPLNADEAWDYVNKMNTYGSFELIDPHAPTEEDIRHIGGLTFIIARTTHGEIGYSLAGEVPDPPKESQDTLVRFAGVFDLAYKRFEDLKEAEKRNRETQIELALERVRSRTMAMQHSDELSQTAAEMFAQLQLLGIQPWSCGFNIINLKEKNISQWVSSGDGRILPPFDSPSDEDVFVRFTDAFRQGEKLFTEEMGGEALEAHYKYLTSIPAIGEIAGEMKATGIQFPTFQVFNLAFFKYGYLMFITYEQVPAFHEIFQRFAKVFEQTYTRFLDLQKAEVQAREALIEAALERVRSRAMAMQKSEELLQVIKTLSEQLRQLGLHAEAVSFLFSKPIHAFSISKKQKPRQEKHK
jgi:hypothetical protein